jgi:hypothetical protein
MSISLFWPARIPTSARVVNAASRQIDRSERTIEKFLSQKFRNLRVTIYAPVVLERDGRQFLGIEFRYFVSCT